MGFPLFEQGLCSFYEKATTEEYLHDLIEVYNKLIELFARYSSTLLPLSIVPVSMMNRRFHSVISVCLVMQTKDGISRPSWERPTRSLATQTRSANLQNFLWFPARETDPLATTKNCCLCLASFTSHSSSSSVQFCSIYAGARSLSWSSRRWWQWSCINKGVERNHQPSEWTPGSKRREAPNGNPLLPQEIWLRLVCHISIASHEAWFVSFSAWESVW